MDDATTDLWPFPAIDEPIDDPVPPSPPTPPPPASSQPERRRWRRGGAALAAAVLAGGAAGGLVGRATGSRTVVRTVTPAAVATTGSGTGTIARPTDIQQVLPRVQPSVVAVRTQAYRRGSFYPSEGAGSGIIIDPAGLVLTNGHVVEGATSIDVTFTGERTARPADLVGIDTKADVALVRIRNASGLPTATLGRSADLRVGDSVIAIGNALDLGSTPTVTEGIVSALNRSIDAPGESLSGVIQTDAAINPGNSGGPLVDAQGRVVGMNTAIAGLGQNIGFALAIDNVKPVAASIEAHPNPSGSGSTAAATAFLGISVADDGSGGGAVVQQVVPGSPAGRAGLQVGDVVTAIGGTSVTSAQDLVAAVRSHEPGDTMTVTWLRGQAGHHASVKLVAAPAPAQG
jgi:serine protease Do